jgi:hypothetical protein
MVSAGTGANVNITLFVIGEGRWETENFPNGAVDPKELSWDFARNASNYSALRQKAMAREAGRTWLNTFAKQGSLLLPVISPTTQPTIASLYIQQGLQNGETQTDACRTAFATYADSDGIVVDLCSNAGGGAGGSGGAGGAGGGESCGIEQIGQIDSRVLACGKLDDVAVALTGMHPRDVWLTRLESNLPHDALKDDLALRAAATQIPVENWLNATIPLNPPCELAAAPPIAPGSSASSGGNGGRDPRRRTEMAFFGAVIAALGAALGRRARRPLAWG